MDTQNFQKFCPVCKLPNDAHATICKHCGASFSTDQNEAPTTRKVDKEFELTQELKDQIIKAAQPPAKGLLLFLLNSSEPIAVLRGLEFILGRGEPSSAKEIFDLTPFNAFAMGVSRSHAMIKAVEDKYVLIDLNSSNGTWLNGARLLPHRPHDLHSEGVIQLGRLQLLVMYSHPSVSK
jgi:FHA domain